MEMNIIPQSSVRSIEQAEIRPMTESDLANVLAEQGEHVLECSGRYWFSAPAGFYHAVHWMAQMSREEACRPHPMCWGFQTTLSDQDKDYANGSLPLHILSDLDTYDIYKLSPRRRTKLRKCFKEVEFVEITRVDLLMEQCYQILISAQQRTGYGKCPSLKEFSKSMMCFFNSHRGLILGGVIKGQIKGFLVCYTVKQIAYLKTLHLASDAMDTNISTGLVFVLTQVLRRSGMITDLVHSPHTPEKPSLSEHKIGMGFHVRNIPSYAWFAPLSRQVIRKFRPYAYYRLTGTLDT